MYDNPQRKSGDIIALREFQQSLKCVITWLETMGYWFSLISIEYLTKAFKSLPNFLRHSFYKYCNPIKHSSKNTHALREFEKWLVSFLILSQTF